eukprot:COSAG04_NODE_8974_length_911_cov_0.924877_1_plen_39_part_10
MTVYPDVLQPQPVAAESLPRLWLAEPQRKRGGDGVAVDR